VSVTYPGTTQGSMLYGRLPPLYAGRHIGRVLTYKGIPRGAYREVYHPGIPRGAYREVYHSGMPLRSVYKEVTTQGCLSGVQ